MENGKKEATIDNISVSYKSFKKIVSAIEKLNLTDEDQISFEFIVGSCFPNVMKNIKEELRKQFTLGFAEGLERSKE